MGTIYYAATWAGGPRPYGYLSLFAKEGQFCFWGWQTCPQ